MAPPLLALRDMRLTFGGGDLFSGVDLAIHERDRLALVGRNGCGKSTLLKVVAQEIEADGGEIFRQPGVRVAYLAQEPKLDGFTTVLDFILAELGDHEAEYAHRAKILLDSVKISSTADPTSLSGGEARRAALARALVADPDILLLDEPTNHLDMPTIEWLEEELKAYRGAIVMISHDRRFLEAVSNAIIWLDRGETRRLNKNFAEFETWSQEVLEKEREERAKLDKLIAEETRWSHEGITARRKRNMGRMRRLWELRDVRSKQISQIGKVTLEVDAGDTSGKVVIEAKDISKSYGERTILNPFSTRILRGDKIGVIGPNGAGKSTLLKMLTGQLEPDNGTVKLGTNLQTTYFDQKRGLLDQEKSLWDTLADVGGDQIMVRGVPRHVVTYLKEFLFDERQARTPVKALSGGEQNRLMLAKYLAQPTNLLILDEPTNDLDMETLDLLQEMLADYDGTLLLVSHDRDFLDRVVTSTIAFEGAGVAREYPGGYSDYFRQRQEETGAAAAAEKAAKKKAATGDDKPKNKSKKKLSYKEQRDLELLPGKIDTLDTEISELETALADPALFTKNPDAFQSKTDRLQEAMTERDAAEERWLELEMLKEELAELMNLPTAAIAMAAAVAVIWGVNVLAIRIAVAEIPPVMLSAIRFFIVAAVCLPFVSFPKDRLKQILLLSLTFGTGHFGGLFVGMTMVEAGPTGILLQLGVPFTSLLAAFIFGDRLGKYRLTAMAVAFGGVTVLMWDPTIASLEWGLVFIICSAFFWATANIQIKKLSDLTPFQITGSMALFAAPQLLILSFAIEENPITRTLAAGWEPWACLAYIVVMSSLLSYAIWYHLLKTYPVNQVVPFSLLAPVITILMASIFLDEPLTANRIIGGLIVLSAVAVIIFRTPAKQQPIAEE